MPVGVLMDVVVDGTGKVHSSRLVRIDDAEMKELAAKSGFELVNVGMNEMDPFMKDKIKLYTEGAKRLNLGGK